MRIDIITALPDLLKSPFHDSILHRAIEANIVEVYFHNLRDYTSDRYKSIDDYQFGGGSGMVMLIEPIDKCISKLKKERSYDEVIYMTPDGETLNQGIANQLSLKKNLIILCGHYKGVDQRVRDHFVTREIPCDAVIRLIPGVLGNETSALTDSFQDNLLAPPIYTRPRDYKGWKVPEILFSGNFPEIEKWREDQAYLRTKERRPDLLDN